IGHADFRRVRRNTRPLRSAGNKVERPAQPKAKKPRPESSRPLLQDFERDRLTSYHRTHFTGRYFPRRIGFRRRACRRVLNFSRFRLESFWVRKLSKNK